jgi:hypothetical protein
MLLFKFSNLAMHANFLAFEQKGSKPMETAVQGIIIKTQQTEHDNVLGYFCSLYSA